jgi:hypothetical protein
MKKLEALIKGRLKQVEKTSTVYEGDVVISYTSDDSSQPFFDFYVDHYFHNDDT